MKADVEVAVAGEWWREHGAALQEAMGAVTGLARIGATNPPLGMEHL